jgi:Zn-dependent peptidase ImmA (M78 family)
MHSAPSQGSGASLEQRTGVNMPTVSVKPDLFKWARTRAGLSADELQRAFPKLADWEGGRERPTLKELERFAGKTHAALGYFFLDARPAEQLPVTDFRTKDGTEPLAPSADLLETIYAMQRRQEWMREFELSEGGSPLPFVGSASVRDDVDRVADAIRRTLGLDEAWANSLGTWTDAFRSLRQAVDQAGILVVINGVVGNNTHRKLNPDEFRGFVLVDAVAPLIFVNGADAVSAQMFTVAHELAHVWIGEGGVFLLEDLRPSTGAIEKFCDQVAAEFLVPSRALAEFLRRHKRAETLIGDVARQFKVSTIVAARRLLDARMISRNNFFAFIRNRIASERRSQRSGGHFWNTQGVRLGERFTETVIRATLEGKLLYREAWQLTGLKAETFDKLVARRGGK